MAQGETRLISLLDPKSPVVEAYRTLRTNLQYANADGSLRRILVTSPGPGEGKSTTAANLAVILAQSGKRVVAVSADLRKPTLHQYFDLGNNRGVTNVLVGQANMEDCLQETVIENLSLLASGPTPPNPAELLGSAKMKSLLEALQERADVVVYDAPPVVAVTDAAVLAPLMDGVLLVLNVGTVPRELAIRTREQLEKVGARILGVVLNRVSPKSGYGYYYYYYYTDESGKAAR